MSWGLLVGMTVNEGPQVLSSNCCTKGSLLRGVTVKATSLYQDSSQAVVEEGLLLLKVDH